MNGRLRRRVAATVLSLGMVTGALVSLASPAGAATITVHPGQSIQAAIDQAPPGSTIVVLPGTYRENLVITKDAITLKGSGPGDTRLLPPARSTGPCFDPEAGGAVGICVLGQVNFDTGVVRTPVRGVRVTGFLVRNFRAPGIFVFGGLGTTIDHNRLANNGGYGIFALVSTGTRILDNVAFGSDEAGIYVGDSPKADALVRGNEAFDNGIGVFLRSASQGAVTANDLHDNCAGVLLLDEPEPPRGWAISDNRVNHNNRVCPASDEAPPFSGVGILLIGARQNVIQGNTVNDNRPGGPTFVSGGIVLVEGSNNNTVVGNTARGNRPADLVDQSGASNSFAGNDCRRSIPPGLCGGFVVTTPATTTPAP